MISFTAPYYERLTGMEHYIELLGNLRRLGSVPDATSASRTRVGRAGRDTRARLRERRDWEVISFDGCVLSLAAQFEVTMRDLIEWFITSIPAKVPAYPHLPEIIRDQNVRSVGRFLVEFDMPRYSHLNLTSVVSDLSISTGPGSPVTLFAPGFSMTESNLRANEIARLLKTLGFKDPWGSIAANRWLQAHFGLAANRTRAAAENTLNQFMNDRNQIAHRGTLYRTLGAGPVLDYVRFFRVLLGAIVCVFWDEFLNFP